MEYALHEIGLGGCAAIHKYWVQGIQDYAVKLDQEDLEMIQEYKALIDPSARKSAKTSDEGGNSQGSIVKDEVELKGNGVSCKTSVGTDTSDQGPELSLLSPYGMVSNGSNTGEGNSDPTSPQWGMSYIKTEGEEDESYEDPMNVVPKTPQS